MCLDWCERWRVWWRTIIILLNRGRGSESQIAQTILAVLRRFNASRFFNDRNFEKNPARAGLKDKFSYVFRIRPLRVVSEDLSNLLILPFYCIHLSYRHTFRSIPFKRNRSFFPTKEKLLETLKSEPFKKRRDTLVEQSERTSPSEKLRKPEVVSQSSSV